MPSLSAAQFDFDLPEELIATKPAAQRDQSRLLLVGRDHVAHHTFAELPDLIERKRVHPLLGWPLKDAVAGWENILDPRTQPWLADHCVGGAVVLPGAAYIEMALAAAREWFGGASQEIEELDIVAPVVFDGEHGRSIRLDLNPRDGGFQIRSRQRLSDEIGRAHV